MKIDKLYTELVGSEPKNGSGYELITDAVLKCLEKSAKVENGVTFKKNIGNGSNFQSCGKEHKKSVFVESIDLTEQGGKVGSATVAKLAGSILLSKNIDKAVQTSSTGFSESGSRYSEDFNQISDTPIDLYIIRPVTKEDMNERVMSIEIDLNIYVPNYKKAKWNPELKPEAHQILKNLGYKDGENIELQIDGFYDQNGKLIESIANLTENLKYDKDSKVAKGVWEFDDMHIMVNGKFVPIICYNYEIPFEFTSERVQIDAGEPKIFVKSVDGSVDTLINLGDVKSALVEVEGS